VDREELIDVFWQAVGRQDLSKPTVLFYYGLGGIGKSSRQAKPGRESFSRSIGSIDSRHDFPYGVCAVSIKVWAGLGTRDQSVVVT
jgi:hypothetical protein